MPFLHFYSSSRLSVIYPKPALFYIKVFILLCLPFNTALAGEIFATGFESGSLDNGQEQQNSFSWGSSTYATVSTENPKSGRYSLRFRFRAAGGDNPQHEDAWAEQRFNLGGNYKDMWVKFDLFIPSNYVHRIPTMPPDTSTNSNNKAGVWLWGGGQDGYKDAYRNGPLIGAQWWSRGAEESEYVVIARANVDGKITLNKNWNCAECSDGKSNYGIIENDKGHWMTITSHYKYATIANNDGIAEVWKTDWQGNTIKLVDIHDGPWYATKPQSTEPGTGFDAGYLLGWAASGFIEETIMYIDNITFSTTPLSTDSDTPNTLAPPMPPTVYINNTL